MIFQTNGKYPDFCNKWKYVGKAFWGNELMLFWTNSKHQYYKLKNGKMKGFKFKELKRAKE